MLKPKQAVYTAFFLAMASAVSAPAQDVDIAFEKFVLDNGLTLVVHEDHKAPIVAVNVWYHVGSKNEKAGKTGFAHLFEHLMFNGSEHFDDDYFVALERIGATDLNGTTNEDRTNYFQNVPSTALDVVLWMESDRMGHLLGAITQEKLDEQRGVVQNEKRQGEDRPYGKVWNLITEGIYPAGHPYSWSVIGSMDDLNAASLEDVNEWFKTYYGAANATIVIAGDVTAAEARAKVERYFGEIAPGPTLARHDAWIAKRSGEQRQILEDRVPQARIYKVWNTPEWGTAAADYLNLVGDVLAAGKTSRLYKRLVYEDQIATGVSSDMYGAEIGGAFYIDVTAQPGQDLAAVEKALDEELARLLAEGVTAKELERVKTQYISGFVRGSERIGGFGGKSDILAEHAVYAGDPGYYRTRLTRVHEATADDLHAAAKAWLSDGVFVLEVHPFPEYATGDSDIDRSKVPEPASWPEVDFPARQEATLSNGLKVILAERHAVPAVDLRLMVDAGYAADQFGVPGTANLALNMMDEGTKSRSALQISEELALLGASIGTGSDLDMSTVSLSALSENLQASLEVFADVVLNPAFPEREFARLKKEQLAAIQREKATPIQMALRVFPRLLYGPDHAYGLPLTGSGNEASVTGLTRDELADFHRTWFRPNNATLVIGGATTLAQIVPKLEKLFKKWSVGDVPQKNVAAVEHQSKPQIYFIDRPGSAQSVIFAGHVAPPKANPDEIAIGAMNDILGGQFTSRINMNLREDKHWSYGARSLLLGARGQRPFLVYARVQTDKTKESMLEIQKELQGMIGEVPPTAAELTKVKNSRTLALPGRWETTGAVVGSIAETVRYGLADDFWDQYSGRVRGLDLDQVAAAAGQVLYPERLVWVVVGDAATVEAGLGELGFGAIQRLDADGNELVGE